MSKKEDEIKILIEKARRGDEKELTSLIRVFSRWLRSSYAKEVSQPSVCRLKEKFLQNLYKLVWKIERIQNADIKTRIVQTLSRLVETIYNTTDSGTLIKYIERISLEIERITEEQTVVKILENITNLLVELPKQTSTQSLPTRKKRGGCLKGELPPPPLPPEPAEPPPPEEEKRKKKVKKKEPKSKGKGMPADKEGTRPVGGEVSGVISKKKTKKKKAKKRKTSPRAIDTVPLPEKPKHKKKRTKAKKKKKLEKLSPVTFRAHWQHYTVPQSWTDLLIYLYSGLLGEEKADIDVEERIKELEKLDLDTAGPVPLKQGTKVLVKPEMPGFRFSPEECIVKWYKDFVPIKFGMMTELKGQFPKHGKKVDGQVNFFVGPLLIAEINLNVIVKKRLSGDEKFPESKKASAPYQKIFASYAHEDSDIVEVVEEAYSAFGNEYMRDFVTLRSGEEWDPALLKLIREADVFHLFWSKASKKSENVEKEWHEALRRKKKRFIRPAYWETPMPKPLPKELKKFHFKKIEKMIQRLIA